MRDRSSEDPTTAPKCGRGLPVRRRERRSRVPRENSGRCRASWRPSRAERPIRRRCDMTTTRGRAGAADPDRPDGVRASIEDGPFRQRAPAGLERARTAGMMPVRHNSRASIAALKARNPNRRRGPPGRPSASARGPARAPSRPTTQMPTSHGSAIATRGSEKRRSDDRPGEAISAPTRDRARDGSWRRPCAAPSSGGETRAPVDQPDDARRTAPPSATRAGSECVPN